LASEIKYFEATSLPDSAELSRAHQFPQQAGYLPYQLDVGHNITNCTTFVPKLKKKPLTVIARKQCQAK